MTAAEQLLEDLLEVRVDLLKARREQLLHLAAHDFLLDLCVTPLD